MKLFGVSVVMLVLLGGHLRAQAPVIPLLVSAPIVMPAEVARLAAIAGDVRLSVTTDGSNVVKIEVLTPKPILLLADPAIASVKQWQFARHAPTTFATTFKYRYKSVERCPESDTETEVSARPPVEVTVTTSRFSVWSERGPRCGTSNDGKVIPLANLAGTLTCECRSQAPVADALIIVWQPGVPASTTVKLRSDAQGRFSAPSLPDGQYYVDVHKPGFRFKRVPVNLVTSGAAQSSLDVAFRPEPHPDPIPPFVVPRELPTYPDGARSKAIEGDVMLRRDASGQFTILAGPPELATPALQYARTLWFQSPAPSLEVRYRYRLVDGDCGPDQHPSIEMRLPSVIAVTAKKPIVCRTITGGK